MKILLLNYEYPPLGGGGGVACKVLAKGWRDLGHQVTVLTSHFKDLPTDTNENGVRVIRVPVLFRSKRDTASFVSQLTYLPSGFLQYWLKNIQFDVINTHFAVPTGPLGFAIARLNGKPNILSIHGADIHDPSRFSPDDNVITRKVNSFIINSADAVVAQSSNTRKNAQQFYKIKKQIEIIPLAYQPFSFESVSRKQLGLNKDKFYLISIGRLVKRKGFDYLIKVLSQIEDKNVELLLIGKGPEKELLQNLARSVGVGERVHFLGFVSEEEKFQYLETANLYVLSSLHEGFGIVLQEAMQVGLPIVATNNGGQVDLVEDGVNGFLVEPENTSQLTDKIGTVLQNKQRCKLFRTNGRKKLQDYEYQRIAGQYIDLFEQHVQ